MPDAEAWPWSDGGEVLRRGCLTRVADPIALAVGCGAVCMGAKARPQAKCELNGLALLAERAKDDRRLGRVRSRWRMWQSEVGAPRPRRSVLDILNDTPGHLLFKTAEEVDEYIRGERDS